MKSTSKGFIDEDEIVPHILLFNKGHNIAVTMEKDAVATIKGKRVRALKKISFNLLDGDDSDFDSRIKKGFLKKIKDDRLKSKKKNDILPTFNLPLSGGNEVRVVNPNDFSVTAGLRSGNKGKDFVILANESKSIFGW